MGRWGGGGREGGTTTLITVSVLCSVGTQMLKDVVDHCKACSKTNDSYQAFKNYVLTSSPSRTLYILEVHPLELSIHIPNVVFSFLTCVCACMRACVCGVHACVHVCMYVYTHAHMHPYMHSNDCVCVADPFLADASCG